jgi:hypothetical protein
MMITQKSRRRSFNIFDHSISLQLSKTIYFSFISFQKIVIIFNITIKQCLLA